MSDVNPNESFEQSVPRYASMFLKGVRLVDKALKENQTGIGIWLNGYLGGINGQLVISALSGAIGLALNVVDLLPYVIDRVDE